MKYKQKKIFKKAFSKICSHKKADNDNNKKKEMEYGEKKTHLKMS